jgi:hypothetical protein
VSCGGAAGRAGRGDHHRRGHAGLDPGLVFPVPGQGPGVLACVLAYLVEADFGGFPVQDAVAAADAFPGADGAQFRRGDGGLDAQAVQVLEVVVGGRTRGGRSARSGRWPGPEGRRRPG